MLDAEPAPGAAEAADDLVGDHQDAVAVADLAQHGEVFGRRLDPAARGRHRLDDDSGDLPRPFALDHLFHALRALHAAAGVGEREGAAVAVGVEEADDVGVVVADGKAPRVAARRQRARRGAVVRAVFGEDLAPAGDEAGDGHRDLGGLAAAPGEEGGLDVAGRDLCQLAAELLARGGRVVRADIAELAGLLLDRRDHLGMLVAEIDVHQLRREVEIALSGRVVKVGALAALHLDHRGQRILRGPGDDVVAPVRTGRRRLAHVSLLRLPALLDAVAANGRPPP